MDDNCEFRYHHPQKHWTIKHFRQKMTNRERAALNPLESTNLGEKI